MTEDQQTDSNLAADRIGDYLLKGWTLTNSTCGTEGCIVPLVRHKTGPLICVLCTDQGSDIATQLTAKHQIVDKHELEPVDAIKEMDRNTVSKLIGQKLLAGWCMLENACEVCQDIPLMRSKQMELLCVKCGGDGSVPVIEYEESKSEEFTIVSPVTQALSLDRDAVSKLIGQKLLAGWCMMPEACELCQDIPLMRSKGMELLCVKCGGDGTFPVELLDSEVEDRIEDVVETIEVALPISSKSYLQEIPVVAPAAARSFYGSVSPEQSALVATTRETLWKQMESYSQMLQSCAPGQVSQICEAIANISKAISELSRL